MTVADSTARLMPSFSSARGSLLGDIAILQLIEKKDVLQNGKDVSVNPVQ
jgi:hypothetical protein